MTGSEFAVFANLLRTAYPREKLLPNREAIEIWYRLLSDIPYPLAEAFLKKWISTEKWSPAVSDIRIGVSEMTRGALPDWSEAWAEVLQAVRQYGYYEEVRALKHLRPLTGEAVRRLGWQNICSSENESVDRASFRQCYEALVRRKNEENHLSEKLKDTLVSIRALAEGASPLLPAAGTEEKNKQQSRQAFVPTEL